MAAGVELASGLAAERDGDLARAESPVARSVVRCRRSGAPVEIANALLRLARVHRVQGLDVVAGDEVEEATKLVKSCLDPGPRMQRLTARARSRVAVGRADRPSVRGGLSERELGVLRLLASDLTQREIGREPHMSLNTVKPHTRSVFRKLGVSGQERAVARARELELI